MSVVDWVSSEIARIVQSREDLHSCSKEKVELIHQKLKELDPLEDDGEDDLEYYSNLHKLSKEID